MLTSSVSSMAKVAAGVYIKRRKPSETASKQTRQNFEIRLAQQNERELPDSYAILLRFIAG